MFRQKAIRKGICISFLWQDFIFDASFVEGWQKRKQFNSEWTFPPLDKILKKFKIGKNFTTA